MDTLEKINATFGPPAIRSLVIDASRQRARVGGEELYLSEAEFALLSTLAAEPGRLFTHAELGETCYVGILKNERCGERLARKLELRGMAGQLRCQPGVGLALETASSPLGAG